MKISPRLTALVTAAVGVALVTGCDPESSVAKPTPVASTQAPATVAVPARLPHPGKGGKRMNYYGCEVLGVEADHGDTADIVIHLPESIGPELFTNIPVTEIDGWPTLIDHSRPGCCAGERDRAPLTPTAVAHPSPVEEAGEGTNFKEDR